MSDDTQRLQNIEALLRHLLTEMQELRAAVRSDGAEGHPREEAARPASEVAPVGIAASPPLVSRPEPPAQRYVPPAASAPELTPPPLPPPGRSYAPPTRRSRFEIFSSLDFESLVGRYGTIALATITILVGAGAFISWAIANGRLGPELRVLLGSFAALTVGAVGWRLRRRAPAYGNALLGLALALVHVNAWGAGPSLHIIPTVAALPIAAIASLALVALAIVDEQQSLFTVGVGGALLAPFVTSSGGGSVLLLLTYGWMVITAALGSLRHRQWRYASRVVIAGGTLYTLVGLGIAWRSAPANIVFAPALFALACSWSALFASGREHPRVLALWYLALSAVAQAVVISASHPLWLPVAIALLSTATAYYSAEQREIDGLWRSLAGSALPLVFFGIAAANANAFLGARGAVLAGAWTCIAVAALLRSAEEARPLHMAVTAIVSAATLVAALGNHPEWCIVGLAVHVVVGMQLLRRTGALIAGGALFAELLLATLWAFTLLGERSSFGYPPFGTTESVAAGAVSVAWILLARGSSALAVPAHVDGSAIRALLRALAVGTPFMWGHTELAGAIDRDVATFLLIIYYATFGIALVIVGRRHGIQAIRYAGLALALYSSAKAMVDVWDLPVAMRVGSCILVGVYLFFVGYWYRAPDASASAKPADGASGDTTRSAPSS